MMAGFQAEENLTGRAPKKMCEKFWTLSVKVRMVTEKLKQLKLEKDAPWWREAPKKPSHTTTFPRLTAQYPHKHPLERINRELRRRTGVVGNFPDGQSALMLVCAGLRYIAGHK